MPVCIDTSATYLWLILVVSCSPSVSGFCRLSSECLPFCTANILMCIVFYYNYYSRELWPVYYFLMKRVNQNKTRTHQGYQYGGVGLWQSFFSDALRQCWSFLITGNFRHVCISLTSIEIWLWRVLDAFTGWVTCVVWCYSSCFYFYSFFPSFLCLSPFF